MSNNYYLVQYKGPFGFIKPWTALRDDTIYSQQFLSPSSITGIEILLGVSQGIAGYRLQSQDLTSQQEEIRPKFSNLPDIKRKIRKNKTPFTKKVQEEVINYVKGNNLSRDIEVELGKDIKKQLVQSIEEAFNDYENREFSGDIKKLFYQNKDKEDIKKILVKDITTKLSTDIKKQINEDVKPYISDEIKNEIFKYVLTPLTDEQKFKTYPKQLKHSIINRYVLLQPTLILAFYNMEDAQLAQHSHVFLSRNEDILYPQEWEDGQLIRKVTLSEWSQIPGFELEPSTQDDPESVMLGYNQYEDYQPMYGKIKYIKA